jgi:hypothetical protein
MNNKKRTTGAIGFYGDPNQWGTPANSFWRPWAIAAKVKPGDKLLADGSFRGVPDNEASTVERDPKNAGDYT